MHTTIVSSDDLAAHLDDPTWVIVDCRYDLTNETWGEEQYRAAHIPGAVYASLAHDLSGPKDGRNGRHPLPGHDAMATTFGLWGVAPGMQVVAYDKFVAHERFRDGQLVAQRQVGDLRLQLAHQQARARRVNPEIPQQRLRVERLEVGGIRRITRRGQIGRLRSGVVEVQAERAVLEGRLARLSSALDEEEKS